MNRYLLFISLFCLFLSITATQKAVIAGVSAGTANISNTSTPVKKIKRFKINIGKLRKEIDSHLAKIRESGKKEVNLLDELARIDKKFSQQKRKLFALQERLAAQEELLIVKESELKQARANKENMRLHLENRLQSFYTMGKTGFLNVTFSTKNLPDLLLFNDSFMRLLAYDQSVIAMYRQTISQLQQAKQTRLLEQTLLKDFIAENTLEKKKLSDVRQEKHVLLNKIKTQKNLYQQALKEMQNAEMSLTATLKDLKRKVIIQKKGFALAKGKLSPPVRGNIVRRFGENSKKGDDNNAKKLNGITIKTAKNEQVKAVFSGKVLFSGYMRGYGNMIIIDHGLRYYSISSRLDSLMKKENDFIEAGDILGTTGDIATLFDEGFYFEIRNNSKPLDPLNWLNDKLFQKHSKTR